MDFVKAQVREFDARFGPIVIVESGEVWAGPRSSTAAR
jgi:hypothetical protein